jgi:Fe-S cluster biogenesis protein NfuA
MTNENNPSRSPLYDEVSEVIKLIRPSIQADGGDIELVSVDEKGLVSVRFLGACIGCPSLDMTLQGGVEVMIKSRVDGVTAVQPVE